MAMFNVQRVIIPKVGKLEFWFMCSAHCLIKIYICVRFCENISNGIKVTELSRNFEAPTDGQTDGHSKYRTV